MRQYIINTTITENTEDFWIDRKLVKTFRTYAGTLQELIDSYIDYLKDECYIDVSRSQHKKQNKMYRDTPTGPVQVGWALKGSVDIEFRHGWKKRYVTIWAEVLECSNPFEN